MQLQILPQQPITFIQPLTGTPLVALQNCGKKIPLNGYVEMIAKDNVTIGIEWRFGPDCRVNDVAPKHAGAPLADAQQTSEMAAAGCMAGQARGLELSKVVQRSQQQTQLPVSTLRWVR